MFENLDKAALVRGGIVSVVAGTAGKTAKSAIGNVVAEPKNLLEKAELMIGTFVIGSMIASKARDHVGAQYDSIVGAFQKPAEEIDPETTD